MTPERIKRIEPAPPVGDLVGMGLLRAEDPLDRRFMMPRGESARTHRSWLPTGPVLDQGATSECVIYAGDHFLTMHRTVNKGFGTAADRTRIYKAVQRIDEWPGENYDGTSIRAMMKLLKGRGQIAEYRWGEDLATVLNHVKEISPVLMGTEWSWDMMQPDEHGYVYYNTASAGGHGWCLSAVNDNRKNPDGTTGAGRIFNNWGPRWGQNGRAWIPYHALKRLIQDWGECAMATEVKLAVA